jgi:hypothetical protein
LKRFLLSFCSSSSSNDDNSIAVAAAAAATAAATTAVCYGLCYKRWKKGIGKASHWNVF